MSDASVVRSNLSFAWPDGTGKSAPLPAHRRGTAAHPGPGDRLRTETERMNLLARFLFRGARAHLPAGVLSGGERLRATPACVLCAEPAPRLLLPLDEPANDLDLVGVGRLEGALGSYRGAFVVVSHDERFLTETGVERWLRPADGELTETAAPAA